MYPENVNTPAVANGSTTQKKQLVLVLYTGTTGTTFITPFTETEQKKESKTNDDHGVGHNKQSARAARGGRGNIRGPTVPSPKLQCKGLYCCRHARSMAIQASTAVMLALLHAACPYPWSVDNIALPVCFGRYTWPPEHKRGNTVVDGDT